jgi:hypothetical protein
MSSLASIPKRAIVSIQPDPEGPFEFMNITAAQEVLNSRHVGGRTRRKRGGGLAFSNKRSRGSRKNRTLKRHFRK